MNRGPAILLALTAALVAGAGVALAVAGDDPTADEQVSEFHRLVGGLGGGPAIDLSRCEAAFDPRLCRHCAHETGPVPAGGSFCPHAHAHSP
ncbi:MAG TPA: hypothetical protein VKD90_17305 [Gemmataceae bacterium]|nr:hypothetical protein [Gemmataceae bacterium]